jgi:hypothetical protein
MRHLILIFTAFILFACKKDKPVETSCVAGTGGGLTLVAYPEHHGKAIVNISGYPDTVYLKFNTQDFPGSLKNFDRVYVGEEGEDHVHISGLKCGNYYIYATGFDTTINQRVAGGIPFSTSQTSGEVSLKIPVTE